MSTPAAARKIKPADDVPFDFNLDAVASEVDLSPWRVHYGGKRWTFRHLEELNEWTLVESAERGEASAMLEIFRQALGEQFAEFRKLGLPRYRAKELWAAYQKYCGIDPGELQGSTGS